MSRISDLSGAAAHVRGGPSTSRTPAAAHRKVETRLEPAVSVPAQLNPQARSLRGEAPGKPGYSTAFEARQIGAFGPAVDGQPFSRIVSQIARDLPSLADVIATQAAKDSADARSAEVDAADPTDTVAADIRTEAAETTATNEILNTGLATVIAVDDALADTVAELDTRSADEPS
jgi:hypothetical protein